MADFDWSLPRVVDWETMKRMADALNGTDELGTCIA